MLLIACIFCSLFVYEFVRSKFSFLMYINLNSLQNIVFIFNTRSSMYKTLFTHVKFYLGRAFEIFDIPVIRKLVYTQLGIIDNSLIIYYTITYWLINIYLPVTICWFTCFDKTPEFISIDFTPHYITVLENRQLCNGVLVFDLLHVYTSIIERLMFSIALFWLLFSAIYILTYYLAYLLSYVGNFELRCINICSYLPKVSRTLVSTIRLMCIFGNLEFQQKVLACIHLRISKLAHSTFLVLYIMFSTKRTCILTCFFHLQLYYFENFEFELQASTFLRLSFEIDTTHPHLLVSFSTSVGLGILNTNRA